MRFKVFAGDTIDDPRHRSGNFRAMSSPELVPVAAVILTYNEELNIAACLESVIDIAEEIFIVDSGSTDKTIEICRTYSDKIFVHPFVDHPSQWNWALTQLPIASDWILHVDADHRLSPALKSQIRAIVATGDQNISGYYARHRYLFLGCPIRGFKKYSLRMFRRSRTHVDMSEVLDNRFVIDGQTAKMAGVTVEDNRKEWTLDFWLQKHIRYASALATDEVLRRAGHLQWTIEPKFFGSPDERAVWLRYRWQVCPLYLRPFLYFFYRYVLRFGFLDGFTGLLYHFLQAFWFRLVIDIKIAELQRRIANGDVSLEELANSLASRY
jgi:glycosyltransferase involved in cell wall biosynthesis